MDTLKSQYTLDGSTFVNLDILPGLENNTWYVLQIVLDDVGGFTLHVYKESDPSVRGFYRYAMPAGKSWRFHHWIYRNNAYIDEYREFAANVYQYDSDPIQRIDTFDDSALPSGWAASASSVQNLARRLMEAIIAWKAIVSWGGEM